MTFSDRLVARFDLAPQRRPEHMLVIEAPEPVEVMIDPVRIDQVITNLVSNALKYSPNGGTVRVIVRGTGDEAIVSINDEGMGILPEEQPRLFQPFSRGDVVRQSIGGTGLGLYISAEIINRHNGSIEFESTPGQGSTFTVRLPVATTSQTSIPGSD